MKIEIKQNDLLLEHTRMVLFLFIISVLAVALLATSTAGATGTETISIGSATVDSGDIVVLPITIADVTDVTGVDVTIVYDANIVIIQNVVANNVVTDSSVYPNIDNTVGKATISLTNTNLITATSAIPIIDITFEVVGNSGSSTLELQDVELSDALFNVYTPSTNNGNLVLSNTINSGIEDNTIVDNSIIDNTIVDNSLQNDSTNDKSNEDEDSDTRYASISSQENTQNKDANEIPSAIDQPKSAIPGFGWLFTVLSLLFVIKIHRNK